MSTTVKMSILLPVAQLTLAITLLVWARHQPVHMGTPDDAYYTPTVELLCYGINAPVAHLSWRIDQVLSDMVGRMQWRVAGFYSNVWFFLMGVVVLWYLVGKKIDGLRSLFSKTREGKPLWRILWNLFAALLGINLFIVLCLHNVVFTDPRNGTGGGSNFLGSLIEQILWLIWSFVLIVVPAKTLVAVVRKRNSNAPGA
jgi:hypothetical protein